MDIRLDEQELRILGCLIEKEMTTPEYYPLSLNSLTNACNQKSNRNPVVSYSEVDVQHGLERLQEKNLARETYSSGSRVAKYLHTLLDSFDLSKQELAVLCELMLRGPQTAGELRSRSERMAPFESLEKVDEILRGLLEHDPALVIQLPREAGRKERRYMHLLSVKENTVASEPVQSENFHAVSSADGKLVRMEEEIIKLREEVEALKQAFSEFRSQF
jgi:uncharacterized protein YceH (UPF0502 family)